MPRFSLEAQALYRRQYEARKNVYWRSWDPYSAERHPEDFIIPTTQIRAGTILYHGTAADEDFEVPKDGSSFTTSRRLARDYAFYEARGSRPRILTFTSRRIPRLIDFPDVHARGYDYERGCYVTTYDDACALLSWKFKTRFQGIGFQRMPEAFAAVCKSEYNGLLIRKNDGGATDILLCKPAKWLTFVKSEEVT